MDIYKASDFANRTFNVQWAVEGLVPGYGLNFIYAHPKVGKSILACQLAQSLSTLTPFLEHPVVPINGKPWRVLYVQADEPEAEWAHQLKSIGATTGWDTMHFDEPSKWKGLSMQDHKKLQQDYDFLILDSLVSLYGEMNKTGEAVWAMGHIQNAFKGPILVIHHKRKASQMMMTGGNSEMAFSFALSAHASALYDLKENHLSAKGRVTRAELDLKRTATGLWEIDHNRKNWVP